MVLEGVGLFLALNLTIIYAINAITKKAIAMIIGFKKSWKATTFSIVGVAAGLKFSCQGRGPPSANTPPKVLHKHVRKNKLFFTKNPPRELN